MGTLKMTLYFKKPRGDYITLYHAHIVYVVHTIKMRGFSVITIK